MANESSPEVIVAGAGISGLAFAFKAARAGKRVLVLEREDRVGGCIHSPRTSEGFWFELGAHTAYNSYGGMLEIASATGVTGRLVQRGEARTSFGLLRDGDVKWLTPPKVLSQLNWFEAALHFPVGVFRSKEGRSIESYYAGLVGPRNFQRVLSPFLAAVPSQSADGFPAAGPGSLFKKRPRREDFPRSYGFDGGLQAVCEGIAAMNGVEVRTGVTVNNVRRDGDGFEVRAEDGISWTAAKVAVALPVPAAANALADELPALAEALRSIACVEVESVGVVLPRDACWMPPCAFVVPTDDLFFSAVTRDPFPDETWRAFAFHFRPGVERSQKLARIAEVLRVDPDQLGEPYEQRLTLPAPEVGHEDKVAALLEHVSATGIALVGNYFDGLALEDCVQRAFAEWDRVGQAS